MYMKRDMKMDFWPSNFVCFHLGGRYKEIKTKYRKRYPDISSQWCLEE